jgi:transketolase
MNSHNLKKTAFKIRKDLIEMLTPKETHHIGCSLSVIDLLTYIYFNVLKVNPHNPLDGTRDIFLLSKGHAGAALYATLYEKGFLDKKTLMSYDRNGGILPEHASVICPGVELSTGSLGHALPVGVGFSISFKNDNKKNKVLVMMSDGELNEGSNWESIMFAGHHKLKNLTAVVDLNGFQGYSETKKVINMSKLNEKFKLFGWNVYECNGHDFQSMKDAFQKIREAKNDKPSFIIAKTTKGKGIPFFEGRFDSHYKSIDDKSKEMILDELKKHKNI